jgi:hypothetical protein
MKPREMRKAAKIVVNDFLVSGFAKVQRSEEFKRYAVRMCFSDRTLYKEKIWSLIRAIQTRHDLLDNIVEQIALGGSIGKGKSKRKA